MNEYSGITSWGEKASISNVFLTSVLLLCDTVLQGHIIKSMSQDGTKQSSQRDWLNVLIVESSLVARKSSKRDE